MIIDVVKVFAPALFSFFIGIAITPILTHYQYKYQLWKKKSVGFALDGKPATISGAIHRDEIKKTPRMGGIVVWGSVLITSLFALLLATVFPDFVTEKINFVSRGQTWLPLFTLIFGSLVGLVDDILVVSNRGGYVGGGLTLKTRIGLVLLIGFMGASWFYYKLGVSTVNIPFLGDFDFGLLFIPFFMIVMLALFSGGVIDGIDGLSGGIMASIFGAYAGIAFFQNQIDLATFCSVVVGAILAFLWFNIPPARFYMSETGMLGLTTSLSVVAFLTNSVMVLPIIAFPLFVASGSVIIQTLSKKLRGGKKIFLVAPVHHHFEALGWPSYKVTMRFWIISVITALIGMIIAVIS
ncbi:MAG: hypothetical protein A2648_02430 [Candidatus Lloydbacteria bacterium RIFCSPHIGHO2_01_FULL_41_20]|uniref:Phospho-N-acetylmuramoyl-pentapeptide-transferase n=1 Tax=Candidatus Lloydbacteria bacterium RIFCSPHIGHO2_01_FULL_41_20 TaxID=1798657 RepID=A0A1G2CTL5_9BACT|nr:MAG: hypothetical protein A2648_02430 [Candidatus Lloydbacteria bacterium RIFCSPHIGHO2_01_FULL_41_20]